MQAPEVSIVILNWNGRSYLEKFLPSVLASTYTAKRVILADNASSDDSVDFVGKHFPAVEILRLTENFGFAKGYNEALKQIKSDYFVLLNSDVEVEPDWLEPVIEMMESDPSICIAQPKLLQFTNRQLFEYAGASGGWIDYLGYPFARGRIFDFCEKDEGQYNDNMPIFWASGAAMFMKGNLFEELGGLDEYFFAHQEEIDFCWRAQLAGKKIMVCPASKVYHVGGGTLPKGNARKVFLNFRNNLIMMAKNMPLSESCWKIPYRFILDLVSAIKSMLGGELTYFAAVIKAHWGFIYWFLKKKDRRFFPVSRKRCVTGLLDTSIVFQHFIKGRKRFSEIVKKKN